MWEQIKTGFAYAFGGSLGWRLGEAVANLIARFWRALSLVVIALGTQLYFSLTAPDVPEKPVERPAKAAKPLNHQQR